MASAHKQLAAILIGSGGAAGSAFKPISKTSVARIFRLAGLKEVAEKIAARASIAGNSQITCGVRVAAVACRATLGSNSWFTQQLGRLAVDWKHASLRARAGLGVGGSARLIGTTGVVGAAWGEAILSIYCGFKCR